MALKVLPPDLVADPERRKRFLQEAQAVAALDHPHIAVIFEIDEVEDVTFMVMELIRGEKLSDLLARGPLPTTRSLELATEVGEGLARAHDRGILHRDLKPANIMVTEEGHAKIIDFGLAKLIEPLAGEGSQVVTALRGETDPGIVMGTVAYMSPEQARGRKVDHRSDIFSFGIVLHEMLAGSPPFRGETGVETLHAIMKESAPSLPSLGAEVSTEMVSDFQHVLDKCLVKEPEQRYETMKEVVGDLNNARRRLESDAVSAAVATKPRRSWMFAAAGAIAALLAAALFFSRPATETPVSISDSSPSIAVFYFENNTGDPSLDWLRTALTDMLITDLSQSTAVEILSTDRLYQILKEMNRLDERITSSEMVQEVAERANVNTVLLGSFIKAGDNFRISTRLQEAASGKILSTEKVEGVGEDSIFPMVDELTRRIMGNLEVPTAADAELDLDLKDVATSSVEAYRHYAEGIHAHERGRDLEAIPAFEKAIEIDPEFAMALAKLAVVHSNAGHDSAAERYSQRALELADRLTPRERYYIEGWHYGQKDETTARSIEAYEKLLELYPNHAAGRTNIANGYQWAERFEESIRHNDALRQSGDMWAGTYSGPASSYDALGQQEPGNQALQDFLSRRPDSAAGYSGLGSHFTRWGRFEEALDAFERARALDPANFGANLGPWQVFVLREDWEGAQRVALEIASSEDPFWRFTGLLNEATALLYRGRASEALPKLEKASGAYAEPGINSASAPSYAAHILCEQGQPREAIQEAQEAQRLGKGSVPEWEGLFFTAIAQAMLDRHDEAHKTAETLKLRTKSLPTEKEMRRYYHLIGELALASGETAAAIESLAKAESMLPARGFPGAWNTAQHVLLWFSLASAHLAAGDEAKAAEWFGRITEYIHHFVEAKKLAFEDRARFYADPDFNKIPVEELISKEYAVERRKLIDPNRAGRSYPPGNPALDAGDTIYLAVADDEGNMVSLIQSNYRGMGSGLSPDGLGFIFQDRGELFNLEEGHFNTYAPRKRPFHTIIPAFMTQDGQPIMSFGVMGGAAQPQMHAQVVMNIVDFGMNLQEAGDAPRILHSGSSEPTGERMTDGGVVSLESGIAVDVVRDLARMRHRIQKNVGGFGGYQAIRLDAENGVYYGASESRKDGHAAGY